MSPAPAEPPPGTPTRFREPGSQLGFAEQMREQGTWPLRKPALNGDVPTATPHLVIPAVAGDIGKRPLAGKATDPRQFSGIEFLNAAGAAVAKPVAGETYRIGVTVLNLGATASYAGLCDFYLAQDFDVFKRTRAGKFIPPAQGRTGFSVRPNSSVTVESPNTWTPGTPSLAARACVLVHVYDLLLDQLGLPYDWVGNRHVGLFCGWENMPALNVAPPKRRRVLGVLRKVVPGKPPSP